MKPSDKPPLAVVIVGAAVVVAVLAPGKLKPLNEAFPPNPVTQNKSQCAKRTSIIHGAFTQWNLILCPELKCISN